MVRIRVEKADTFAGHKDCIYSLTGGNPSQVFFSAGSDGLVVRWDLNAPDVGTLMAKVNNTVYAMCHLPSSNTLLVAQNFAGIHQIDLETRKEIRSLQLTNSPIFDMKVLGNRLYLVTGDGVLIVVDLEAWAVVKHVKASDQHARCLSISPKAGHLAIGYSDHHIRVFRLSDFSPIQVIPGHANSVFTLQYSPDQRFLLSGSRDAHLKIWDAAQDYALHQSIVAHLFTINHLAYRPDARYFATCSKDKSIKLWDAQEFRLLKVIDKARHAGHGTSVNKLHWADNHTLISASDDRTLSVWNLEFYEEISASQV